MKFVAALTVASVAWAQTTTVACTRAALAASALSTLQTQFAFIGGLIPCAVTCFNSVGITTTSTAQDIIDACNPTNDAIFQACLSLCPSTESLDSYVLQQAEANCNAIEAAAC
ncbi:hypothetical protein HDU82_002639 [Entophlyctis luteolus]|nr:hypothetical protein HDU82_002639 [Entophlyctis luteolus]